MDCHVHTLGYSNPTLEIIVVDSHQRNPESFHKSTPVALV